MIYTFSSNRSNQFSSIFSSRKLEDLTLGLTNKHHEVTKRVSISVMNTYFADYFYYLLLIYIIFLYTDIHSLMML